MERSPKESLAATGTWSCGLGVGQGIEGQRGTKWTLLLYARRRSKAVTSSRQRWEDGDEADQAGGAGGLPGKIRARRRREGATAAGAAGNEVEGVWTLVDGWQSRGEGDEREEGDGIERSRGRRRRKGTRRRDREMGIGLSGGVGAPAGVQGGGGLLRDGCSRSSSPRALGRRGLGEEEAHRRRRRRWWWPWTTARRETAAGDGGPPELAVPVVLRRPGGGCRRRGGGRGDGTRAWRWSREGERRARWIGRRELDASEWRRRRMEGEVGLGLGKVGRLGCWDLVGRPG